MGELCLGCGGDAGIGYVLVIMVFSFSSARVSRRFWLRLGWESRWVSAIKGLVGWFF